MPISFSAARPQRLGFLLLLLLALLASLGLSRAASAATTLNDTTSGITYTGSGWFYSANRGLGDFQNDVHATATNGDSASYTFTGTGISYIGESDSGEGNVQVYLDGTLRTTVNCYSAARQSQHTQYSVSGLSAGSHTLKLVKQDGSYMQLDALVILPSPTPYGGTAVSVAATGSTKVEAENYDLGGEGIAYHDVNNSGSTAYRTDNIGIQAAAAASNGYCVGSTAGGEWDGYTINVTTAGVYTLTAALGSTAAGGTFHLEFGPVGQVGGTGVVKSAEFTFPNTGSYTTFQPVTVAGVSLPAGFLWMRLVLDSAYPGNLDAFTLTPVPSLTSIAVSPASAALHLNGTQQFTAVAKDQNGSPLSPQPALTWSVASGGVGTVSSTGLYSAGTTTGSATIKATSGTVSGTASVTVTNAAPTVATAATANPASVTGTTTALSALGADDGGEANLTYTWATTGTPPAAVSFSANGTNAAKNTTATFTKAGTYGFLVTLKDAGGLTATSSVSVTVSQTLTSIAVSPNPAALNTGATQQFTAAANDQFGMALSTQPALAWTVTGVGTITAAGLYSAGATAGTATVTAKSGTVTGMASVTVNAPAAGISLSLVTAVNNQASLSWSSVSGAASYNVKRSTTNGSGYTTVANVTTTSDVDQGLTNGTPYYYVVTSVSGTTESAPSNQVTATPTAQAFGFLNVGNGSVLSGEVTLSVSMASKAYGSEASPVTFSVDGTVYDTGGDLQQNSGNAGANTTFVLDTDALTNGPHTLNVKDVNGNSATVNVTFSNVLYNISIPNMFDTSGGDGLPNSAAITANFTSAQPWTVSIVTVDSANSVVQSFSGNSANINVSWNGKNSQGVEVADNAYEVDISYGSQGGTASSSAVSPHGAAQPIIRRNLLSKNKIGDCFVFLDQNAFPTGYGDGLGNMIAYLRTIKADLAPSQGNVWNQFSFVIHGSRQSNWTPSEVQRIDNHFRTRLSVLYVAAHGGTGLHGGTEFYSGGHYWESNTYSGTFHSAMQTLTQSANYGVANPPALVFIDSCDSAGEDPNNPDLSFASDFDIGDGPSGFVGWGGFAPTYGQKGPPYDDWTFWRLDFWAQFTNVNQTYDTAYSHLLRDYGNHGQHGGYNSGTAQAPNYHFPDQTMVTDWLSGSAF